MKTDIIFGNAKEILEDIFKNIGYSSKVFILYDDNTYRHCKPLIENLSIEKDPYLPAERLETVEICIKPGDKEKNIENLTYILRELSENNAKRNSILINLGGGMITDIGGFAASVFKRGIKFINIPTTLLAMVDASIGGKTGINFNSLKNEIGSFNEAMTVIIDIEFLKTLDKDNFLSGYGEILKYSMLSDEGFFDKLMSIEFIEDVENIDRDMLISLINKSIEIKKFYVGDTLDNKDRDALNFGHTIGHAIESVFMNRENPILHGTCIAYGLVCEAYLSCKKLNLDESVYEKLKNSVFKIYGKLRLDENDIDCIIEYMMHDKKNNDNDINFVLVNYSKERDLFTDKRKFIASDYKINKEDKDLRDALDIFMR